MNCYLFMSLSGVALLSIHYHVTSNDVDESPSYDVSVFLRHKTNILDFLASYSIANATIGHIYHNGEAGSDDISLSYMFRTVLVMEAVDTTDAKLSEYPLCSVLLRRIEVFPTAKFLHTVYIYYEDDIGKFFAVGT